MTISDAPLEVFYDPDLYDLKIGPGPRVAAVYVPLAREEGGPVLELGTGTGDVLFPIARAGIACVGVDISPAMLGRAREKLLDETDEVRARVALVEGDLAALRLRERFRQIFFTNDVIGHLTTNEVLLAAFASAARHLKPGGRVVLDVTEIDVGYLARASDPWHNVYRHRGRARAPGGEPMDVWERTEYCQRTCRLTAHFRYEHIGPDGGVARVYDRSLTLRPRHPEEIVLALRLAGFAQPEYWPLSRGNEDRAWLITARAPVGSRSDVV